MAKIIPLKSKYAPGEVWRSEFLHEYVMITNSSAVDTYQAVRAVVLCPAENFGDGTDVIVTPATGMKLYMPQKRVALRVTDAIFPLSDLVFKVGELPAQSVKKVIASLKNKNFMYTEYAMKTIHQYLDRLDLLRTVALEKYEQSAVEAPAAAAKPVIIGFLRPVDGSHTFKKSGYDIYRGVADDGGLNQQISELSARVWKEKNKSLILKDDNSEVFLVLIEQTLFLSVSSFTVRSVSGIELKSGRKTLKTGDTSYQLTDNWCIAPFRAGTLPSGTALLSFSLDDQKFSFEVKL